MLDKTVAQELAWTLDERDPRFFAAVWFLVRQGRTASSPILAKKMKHLTAQTGNYIGKSKAHPSEEADIRRGLLRWIHLSPGSTAGEVVRLLRWEVGPLDRKATVKVAEALFQWAAGTNLYLTIDNAIARRYHFRGCVLSEALGTPKPPVRYIRGITHKNYNGVHDATVIAIAGSFVEEEVLAEMGVEYGMLPRPTHGRMWRNWRDDFRAALRWHIRCAHKKTDTSNPMADPDADVALRWAAKCLAM